MKTIITKGSICIDDSGLTYNICTLFQFVNGDDTSFKFVPNYGVIDILPNGLFEGIPGINLDLRKEEYIREGIPPFVYERIPPKNRIDLDYYIKRSGVDYYDPMTLLKSLPCYSGDNLYVTDYIEPTIVNLDYNGDYSNIKEILQNVALNNNVIINGQDADVRTLFVVLYPLYYKTYHNKLLSQIKGVGVRKQNGSYKGRKPYGYDVDELTQIANLFKDKKLSIDDIKNLTGWSKSTFYRKLKTLEATK